MSGQLGRKRLLRAEQVFDALDANPAGLTVDEVADILGCSRDVARVAIWDLRLILADTQDVNVVAEPAAHRAQWPYRLEGELDRSRWWQENRLGDAETRIESIRAVALSVLAHHADRRTREARVAAALVRGLGRVVEDIAVIREDVTG